MLHCANISLISATSCAYPGHPKDTRVCACVEGGGTDSCEVRAEWIMVGRGRGIWEVLRVGMQLGLPALGRENARCRFGDRI